MLRKCLDKSKKVFCSAFKGAFIGGTIGLTLESTAYGIMERFKKCTAIYNYSDSLGCSYVKAEGLIQDDEIERCNQYFKCNTTTTVALIAAYEPQVLMNYPRYAITGVVIGASLGALDSIMNEMKTQDAELDVVAPPAAQQVPKCKKYVIKGASALSFIALMTYCNYIVSQFVEEQELHAWNNNSFQLALLMDLLDLTMGPAVDAIMHYAGKGLSKVGLFSQRHEQLEEVEETELKDISVPAPLATK